jgi:hypothetical protein
MIIEKKRDGEEVLQGGRGVLLGRGCESNPGTGRGLKIPGKTKTKVCIKSPCGVALRVLPDANCSALLNY